MDISGLTLTENFITVEEEKYLIEQIDKSVYDTSLARRTQHYGYVYDYTSKAANKKTTPIPDWCKFVIDRLLQQNILKEIPDQMIVNEYMPGQGIYPHIDHTGYFADGIASLSLGSPVIMDFIDNCNISQNEISVSKDSNGSQSEPSNSRNYNPSNKKEVLLSSRSVISLHEDARYKWRHGITARKSDNGFKRTRRISLTFRKMK